MRLADYMDWKGLDDTAFARLVGSDRTRINRIRRGLSLPSWALVGRIRRATGGQVTADSFTPELEHDRPA